MSNGRIACTDKDVIPFILGRYTEPEYTFASPCPPSAECINNLAAAHAIERLGEDARDVPMRRVDGER